MQAERRNRKKKRKPRQKRGRTRVKIWSTPLSSLSLFILFRFIFTKMNLANTFTAGSFTCITQIKMKSKGIFYGDSPFTLSSQILLVQISVCSLCISILQLLLAPFGQTAFTAQMIVRLRTFLPFILASFLPSFVEVAYIHGIHINFKYLCLWYWLMIREVLYWDRQF